MAGSNFIVRGGADFSKISREFQKTQQQMNSFQSSVNKSMGGIGKAFKIGLGYVSARAIAGFVKATTGIASDLTEVQNVVDVVFGSMAEDINDFSKVSIEQFGLSALSAKEYSSSMGAMLKSSGIVGEGVRDMALDLTKLSADMASFYNLDNDAMFKKLMSGMSGMSMPLKELGINMNIANLEAFAMSQGISKAWRNMTQAEQTMLRYNYLLSVTGDAQGDFARNSHTWANQTKILSQQWEILKGTIGAGFINALMPVVTWFNKIIKVIQVAAEYFKAFTRLIFGDAEASSQSGAAFETMADSLGDVEEGFGGVGKAGKKAAKDLKGAIAGFDEINKLSSKTADAGGGGGGVDIGGVGPVDLGSAASGEIDIDINPMEEKFNRMKDIVKDFYENWGMKDIFKGIKEGVNLVDFSGIKTNLATAMSNLGEISQTALEAMQPIYQAAGEALGTKIKYGIAIAGNIFEPISLGFANFTENMKEPIQEWMLETSETVTAGFNNLTDIYENLGESWLKSIEKYKPAIAKETESTLTNASKTYMLIGTVLADSFEIITGKVKEFTEENEEEISESQDNLLGIFTDGWGFINKVWSDSIGILKKFWDDWGKDIVKDAMDIVKDIGKWFLYLWNDLVKPVWDTMLKWLNKLWDGTWKDILEEITTAVGQIGELIKFLWDKVFQPLLDLIIKHLVPKIRNSFQFIVDVIGVALTAVGEQVKAILKIFNGLITFITGVFTGDWKRAWEGVSKIFGGIMDGLWNMVKIPLNLIISGMNKFLRGLNNIQIPDWVPAVGGKGFNIKELPHLAKGGITNGPMAAVIGDNPGGREVVSPLNDLMAMITQAVNVNSDGNRDTTIIVNVGDETLTEKVVSNINRRNRISGKTVITV